ncbi:hypothetical protein EMCRGX_G024036 [Ephydatia muelleri]
MERTSCESLVNRCKQESKQILEAASASKIHWSHPKFTTFCALVEEILSYGTKKKYQVSRSKPLPPSGKILHDLGKKVKEAEEVYGLSFAQHTNAGRPDYACMQGSAITERRIVWVRVAMVEGKLKTIVEAMATNASLYYEEHSVMRHPLYGDIFCTLLDGPCSLRFSRLKSIDSSFISPSPMEIVKRHTPAMAAIYEGVPTEEAWGHVQSLYQSPGSSVVFGKNNVYIQPPGFIAPLPGYLSLHQVHASILLKWLPNSVLENNKANKSFLWEHVMCIDVDKEVAHLHCHCSSGQPAHLILIGYDGIAHPTIMFYHQPSMFSFLECLENTLLPQGCLEPPSGAAPSSPFTLTPLRTLPIGRGSSSPDDVQDPSAVVSKPGSLARKDWEKFQTKVSRQLLARYFYGWWSYCRHVHNMKKRLSHMISTNDVVTVETHDGLDEATWKQFQQDQQGTQWRDLLKAVYLGGVASSLRPKVWPYLLGLYHPSNTPDQCSTIRRQCVADYSRLMDEWRPLNELYTHQQLQRHTDSAKAWRRVLSTPSAVSAPKSAQGETSGLPGATEEVAEGSGGDTGAREMEVGSGNVPAALLGSVDEIQIHVEECSHTTAEAFYSYCDAEVRAPAPAEDLSTSISTYETKESAAEPGVKKGEEEEEEEEGEIIVPVDPKAQAFMDELYKIDKDIPRCDREYWYFKQEENLTKLRNIITSYVWAHMSDGYSQGMCDLLAPLLVVFDDESLAYSCYLKLMATQRELFPPEVGMNTRMTNLRELLEVTDTDFFQYLQEKPMGDSLFYCYRWFLVGFKREFEYEHVFRLWEATWAAKVLVSVHFEEFFALAIINQYKNAIMDAHMDPSDIVNLFTSLADKKELKCLEILTCAQNIITDMQKALSRRD